jgi:hypothetical protein
VGQIFAPYKSEQIEVGVKIDHGRLVTTLSVFKIKRPSGQLTGNVFAVIASSAIEAWNSPFGEPASSVRLLRNKSKLQGLTSPGRPFALWPCHLHFAGGAGREKRIRFAVR